MNTVTPWFEDPLPTINATAILSTGLISWTLTSLSDCRGPIPCSTTANDHQLALYLPERVDVLYACKLRVSMDFGTKIIIPEVQQDE